jgi:hypothetical protein
MPAERCRAEPQAFILSIYFPPRPQGRFSKHAFLPSAMAAGVFSVPIFFIVFRETLEAAIIISVLLGLVEQIVHSHSDRPELQTTSHFPTEDDDKKESGNSELANDDDASQARKLIRKMRFQECIILTTPHTTCR